MKQDFSGLWAGGVPSSRREPDPVEIAGGFPCGPLDRERDNEMNYRWFQAYRELSNVITLSGQTPSEGDLSQVWKAILAAVALGAPNLHFGTASGTSSQLTVATTTPAIRIPYRDGAIVLVWLPPGLSVGTNANISLGNGERIPILRNDGSPIRTGDGPGGSFLLLGCNAGNNWRLLTPGQAEYPRILGTATIYVAFDGSDTADGRSPATALRTIAAAFDKAKGYYLLGDRLVIQLAKPGTYPFPVEYPSLSGSIQIRGDQNAQQNYILTGSGAGSARGGVVEADGFSLSLFGLTVRNTGTDKFTVAASGGGRVSTTYVTLTSVAPINAFHFYVTGGAEGAINTGTIWASSAAGMMSCRKGDISVSTNASLEVQNTPTWSIAAAVPLDFGTMNARPGSMISGTASGKRFSIDTPAIIRVSGAGMNFFPGDVAGTINDAAGRYYS